MNDKTVEVYNDNDFNPVLQQMQQDYEEAHLVDLKPKQRLIPLCDVEDEEVKWLWYPYIQANNISVLRGDGGAGKTFFSCALMSAITRDRIPDDMPGEIQAHGNVIYFGSEDDPFILKARVKGAGGDLTKVSIFEGEFELSDTKALQMLIKEVSAKMVIFDPIQSFLGSDIDMNRANQIRPIMDGLRGVARSEDCAILLIEHLNKAIAQKALYRGIGSIDVVSASRSVLMIGYHPIEEDMRVCLQIKSNSKRGLPAAFKIDGNGEFTWKGIANVTEEEMAASSGIFSNTNQKDLLVEGIKAIMKVSPSGWHGTSSEIFVEISKLTGTTILTPSAIGKRLSGITPLLNKEGIYWNKRRGSKGSIYELFHKVIHT